MIHYLHKKWIIRKSMKIFGISMLIVTILFPFNWGTDPNSAPKLMNAIYYGLSRPLFTFALNILLLLGFSSKGRAKTVYRFLGNKYARILSKCLGIVCLVETTIFQLAFFSSNVSERGVDNVQKFVYLYTLGSILVTLIVSMTLFCLIEYPVRIILGQLTSRFISHDQLFI